MTLANRRSIMTMYSDPMDPYSHQVRIVLAEKGIAVDIKHLDVNQISQEVMELNPYGTLPILVDRDLVLYTSAIIMEYLDERFPHPPLLPVYPVARAESRRMMFRIEQDWYRLMHVIIDSDDDAAIEKAQADLQENFIALAPVFAGSPYFLSSEFTLVDACLAPLIWRFPQLGVEIPKSAKAIWKYTDRVFSRPSFQVSLSEHERELRAA